MPQPTTTVEIAFDAGFTGTPTWTDVTSYVMNQGAISITRGRGSEGEQCGPNTLSLVLNNSDGRFTPGNASGAHYPNVLKGRRIRVRSTHNAVTYDRFVGYINDWRVSWPGKVSSFATCQVSATSRLARLGNTVELRSIVEETILADDPLAYYTLGEPEGSTQARDTSTENAPALTVHSGNTAPTFGTATGPGTDGLTAALFPVGAGLSATMAANPAALTLETWYLGTDVPSFFSDIIVYAGGYSLQLNTAGSVSCIAGTSTTEVADGLWHHLALTWDGTTARLYVDGVEEDSDTHAGFSLASPWRFTVGVQGDGFEFSAAHVAFTGSALSAADIAAHSAAGVDGFAGDTAAERLARYAALVDIPTGEQDFEAGDVSDLAHIDTTGKTALGAMREVELTEGGVLFDAPSGDLTFHDRSHRYGAASAFTLSYSSGEVTGALSPVLDDQQMANDATATNANGIVGRVVDSDSRDDYGPYRQQFELATADEDEPLSRAGWVVNRLATPTVRVSELEVLLNTATNTAAAGLLSADVGTKLTLSGLPSSAPASTMTLFVEGVSETITAEEHRIMLRTTPASLYDVWLLGTAGATELGSTTVLGY